MQPAMAPLRHFRLTMPVLPRTGRRVPAASRAGAWALCIAALLAATGGVAAEGDPRPQPPRTLVVPGDFPIEPNLARGCWVRLYDGVDFKGRELILAGPLALPRLDAVSPHWRHWDSAMAGPRAVLSAYTAVGFEGRAATVQPGEHVKSMVQRTGRRDDIESLRVDCVPS